jgi:hypothetical protein
MLRARGSRLLASALHAGLGWFVVATAGCAPAHGRPPATQVVPFAASAFLAEPGLGGWEAIEEVPNAVVEGASLLPMPLPELPLGGASPSSLAVPPAIGERDVAPAELQRFTLLPGVALPASVQRKVAAIADLYFRHTRKPLVVTSGTRDPARQAEAMHELFRHGADVLGLYKDKEAAKEIKGIYERGASTEQPVEVVLAAMTRGILAQIERGVFISAHLRRGAVDVRSRDMSPEEKRAFLDGVEAVGGVVAMEESRPPHYHLQIE